MKRFLIAVAVIIPTNVTFADLMTVELTKQAGKVEAKIGGKEFTTFHFAMTQKKPYFSPVRASDGAIVTRGLENPEDHPHHKGIWCAIDEVNGVKFWAEEGKIENHSVEITRPTGNPVSFKIVNHWLGKDGKPLLVETTQVSISANRLIIYDLRFTAADQPVTFGDTKEGMFGIRLADTLRGKAGGKFVNAEGLRGEKAAWGQESKWVDYSGDVGGKIYGVTLFDHPQNFRKSRFHVRDYGLFTLSPFGQRAYTNGMLPEDPLTLEPGKSIRLRYGLFVHDLDPEQQHVREIYESFVKKAVE